MVAVKEHHINRVIPVQGGPKLILKTAFEDFDMSFAHSTDGLAGDGSKSGVPFDRNQKIPFSIQIERGPQICPRDSKICSKLEYS